MNQLDTSDKIVNWVVKSGYSLIDVNVLAQLPTRMSVSVYISCETETHGSE